MKKLLAIFLSVLMLCTMIPFATVSAADEPTIEIFVEETELDAGDEFEVTVNLLNIPDPGLIYASVQLDWDESVMEIVTYYDEDEEDDFPMIEVGNKYNTSANKYMSFGPLGTCNVTYSRPTAKETQTRYEEHFFTATFKIKDDAASGDYTIGMKGYNSKNFVRHGNLATDFVIQDTVITVNGSEPAGCEHEYNYDCDKNCKLCGELTRPEADHTYFDACSAICDVCGYEREVSHNVIHVAAIPATCETDGNIEYWYCDVCGAAWLDAECTLNTNLLAVKQPASCSYNAIHNQGVEPGCHYTGRVENWYCANCDVYYLDAACAQVTNYKNLTIPALQDTAEHVPAKAPTCDEPGNIEYWICYDCEQVWADAALTQLTNYKSVQLAPAHNVIHVEAKDPTCTELGNIEYWYCADCGQAWLDELCRQNTNLMAVKLGASCSYAAEYVAAKEANCYEPGNVEYWYCANCDVYYADEACTIVTNAKNVIIPITHNIIHVEAAPATCTTDGNIEYWYCDICGQAWLDEYCHLNTNLKSVKLPASCSYGAEYVAAKEANCYEPGNVEYWYCANCDVYYADEACAIVTNAKNVIIPITHNIIHVEAAPATCTTDGNIEYWYCDICGQAWLDEYCHLNTNLKSVKLPASCSYGAEYVAAKEANCYEPGNVEYWYCANCDVYYADEACAIVTNAKNVIIPITHNIIHVEAVPATCETDGNIEYWYCDICGQAWLDEYCHLNTNLKSVVLPASCSYSAVYTPAKEATCAENGNTEYWYCANCDVYYADAACAMVTNSKNVIIPALPHTYADDMDVDCDICGDIRVIDYVVKSFAGNSTMEMEEGTTGLAFIYDLTDKIQGLAVVEGTKYVADYSGAFVTPDTTGTYKLVKMGALVTKGDVTKDVAIAKIVINDDGSIWYAVRVINIPEAYLDTEITVVPYFVYEDAEGNKHTVELDATTACAADCMA